MPFVSLTPHLLNTKKRFGWSTKTFFCLLKIHVIKIRVPNDGKNNADE